MTASIPAPVFGIAHWCILAAALLPLLCAYIAKWGSFRIPRREGGYDNADPRAWLARQTAWRARANAAQANSFEALPFFIGAVLVALQLDAPTARLDTLALLWVLCRLVFIGAYVGKLSTLRSLVWALAFALNVAILLLGWR